MSAVASAWPAAALALLLATTAPGQKTVEIPVAEIVDDSVLETALRTIERHFIQPIARQQLEEKTLAALLPQLDPYSSYLSPAELAVMRANLDASFGGVGVNLGFEEASGYPRVEFLLHGGSAGAAGIRRGDLLLAVDGKDMKGLAFEDVSGALRGAVASPVQLRVRRAGVAAPLEFALQRVAIATPSVRARRRDAAGQPDWWLDRERRIGYVWISNFAADSAPTLDRAAQELRDGRARGLVIDLRDCAGGLFRGALDSADLFVGRGRLLTVRERDQEQPHDAKRGKHTRLPLVLLINGGTISSCEIFAGALADNGRGTLVGERSFGKGRVQVIHSLGTGRGAIVISTGTFQRPNGKTIDRHDVPEGSTEAGIAPAIEIKTSEAERTAQLEFAHQTTGTLIFTPEEQQGAPPDRVLDKAIELLTKP